jgi:hypothetical protein
LLTGTKDLSVARHYGPRAMLLGILVCIASIFLGYKPFGKAFVLGALGSVVNLALINLFYSNLLFKTRKAASFNAFVFVLIRFGVLAIPLILGLTNKNFDFIGAALGIFAVQTVILWERLILGVFKKNK